MTKLEEKIINLISNHLGVSQKEITLESSLRKDLGAETLMIADLLAELQEELNLELEEVEPEKIKTVGQLINYIEGKNTEFE
ncbi:hypothetical protein AMJ51_01260 [Microgenomates bacterium DG_75]|nr:MAG: hypothetical protein AMJ51_01260 [Microgenomates bacterium DG_75]